MGKYKDYIYSNAETQVNNISDDKAKAVEKSLAPDNINFPDDLSMKVEKIDNKLVFNFQCIGDTKKLAATVDEVLEHVKLASEIIE